MNTAISDRLIDSTVKPTSRAPRSAASHARHARFEMAGDIFQHDDGVVDDEAGRDGQRHQRQNVEAEAEQIHAAERAENGDRHGDAGDERGADVAQEQEHDEGDQDDAITSVISVSRSDARIVVAAVDGDGDVDVGRHRRLQLRQLRLHAGRRCR